MVGKPFVIGFCSLFWTWPCTTFNSIPIILKLLTNRNIALIYSVITCEQKPKDCARTGSFQHNLQHHCFQLWCCRVSSPVSSTSYDSMYLLKTSSMSVFTREKSIRNLPVEIFVFSIIRDFVLVWLKLVHKKQFLFSVFIKYSDVKWDKYIQENVSTNATFTPTFFMVWRIM